jgi:ParB-like nuclease domain
MDGFWSGIVCRRLGDGTIQMAAGHHRVRAALAAGITHADVFVREDMDDAAMVQAGMVASAIRLLAKALLTGNRSTIVEASECGEATLRGQLASDKGLGEPILTQFLQGIPEMSQRTVREHLANRFGRSELRFAHGPPPITEALRLSPASREGRVIC